MSNETINQDETILGDDEVKVQRPFNPTWRFDKGQIATGSEKKGDLRVRPRIVGRLKKITIRTYQPDDASEKAYQHLSADILTKDGLITVEAWLSDMDGKFDSPSGTTISFAWGLLQLKEDEQCVIEASQSKEANKWGKYPTWVNFFHVDSQGNGVPVAKREKSEKSIEELWDDMKPKLKAHPCWVEPPAANMTVKADTHLANLIKLAESKNWPTPQDMPAEWIKIAQTAYASELLSKTLAGLRDVGDDYWGGIILALKDKPAESVPKLLQKTSAPASVPVID